MATDRSRRSGGVDLSSAGPRRPTESSQLIQRPVLSAAPNMMRNADGLSQAFGAFFRAASPAIEMAEAAIDKGVREREKAEADRMSSMGFVDATQGTGINPALIEDMNYQDAYHRTFGAKTASDVMAEMSAEAETLPLDTDWTAWAAERTASLTGEGLFDPRAQAAYLEKLQPAVTEFVAKKNAAFRERQREEATGVIGATMARTLNDPTLEFTPEVFTGAAEQLMAVDPRLSRGQAYSKAFNMLINSMDPDNPQALTKLESLLLAEGTGTAEDLSFAESFPEVYQEFQTKLLTAHAGIQTVRAAKAYTEVETAITNAQTSAEVISLLNGPLEGAYAANGGEARYGAIREAGIKRAKELADQEREVASLGMYLAGQGTDAGAEWDDAKKHLPAVLHANGMDPLSDDPEVRQKTAMTLAPLPGLDDHTRDRLVAAAASGSAGDLKNAYLFLRAVGDAKGSFDAALEWIPGADAKARLRRIHRVAITTNRSMDKVLEEVLSTEPVDPTTVNLNTISSGNGRQKVIERVLDRIGDVGADAIDPRVTDLLVGRFTEVWARNGAIVDQWEDTMDSVYDEMLPGLGMIISNGQRVLTTIPTGMTARTPDGDRPVLPLGEAVTNPLTGQVLDTVTPAFEAIGIIGDTMLGDEKASLGAPVITAETAYYPITLGNGSVPMFLLGQTVPMADGDDITLPRDPQAAAAILAERYADVANVDVILRTDPDGEPYGLELVYRPIAQTSREQIANYKPSDGLDLLGFGTRTDTVGGAEGGLFEMPLNASPLAAPKLGDNLDWAMSDVLSGNPRRDSLAALREASTTQGVLSRIIRKQIMDGVQDGTLPMTTGVSVPVGNTLYEVSRRLGELRRNGGTMNPAYKQSRFEFVYEGEGFRGHAYDDQTGRTVRPGKPLANGQSLRTIGYGFNLDDPSSKAVFEKAVPGKYFEDVKNGRVGITESEARALYDAKVDESEAMVERFFGADVTKGLPPNVRIALVSMAYNSRVQNGRPTLFGPSLRRHVIAGNWHEVAREIAYRTHPTSLFSTNPRVAHGLINRRMKEAALILGGDSAEFAALASEARQAYRLA